MPGKVLPFICIRTYVPFSMLLYMYRAYRSLFEAEIPQTFPFAQQLLLRVSKPRTKAKKIWSARASFLTLRVVCFFP